MLDDAALLSLVRDYFGPSLQTVTAFNTDGYAPLYFRDDVEALYSDPELDQIFNELVLEGLGAEYFQELFHAGDLVCTMRVFEESVMFLFIDDDQSGAFVTADPETDADVLDFIREVEGAA